MTLVDEPSHHFDASRPDVGVDPVDPVAALAAAKGALTELGALDLDAVGDDELSEAVLAHQQLRSQIEASEARVLARAGRMLTRAGAAVSR